MLGDAYLFLPVRYIYQLKFYCKRRMQEGIPSYMERITPRGNVEGSNDTDFNTASRKGYQVWDAVK